MNLKRIILGSLIAVILLSSSSPISFAEEINSKTEITALDPTKGIEKTTLTMVVPDDNQLPWGFVEGNIANHVKGYPVIIQIFDDNENADIGNNIGAIHFAQTEVDENGNYEYKFRVRNVEGDNNIDIFNGSYTVKIFKVVYLSTLNSI